MFGGQTVMIVTRSRDELTGDVIDTARISVDGCSVQPVSVSEDSGSAGGAQQATQRIRVFGPVELGRARASDVLETQGWQFGQPGAVRLQVVGDPMVWPDERGAPHHTELDALIVTG